jgi:hypothetical protein
MGKNIDRPNKKHGLYFKEWNQMKLEIMQELPNWIGNVPVFFMENKNKSVYNYFWIVK